MPSFRFMPMDTATDLAVGEPVARHGHSLTLEGITHRFGAATAVAGVNLAIDPGEMIAFLGPSGCGKSTLLRIIAGFIAPSAGRVLIDGAPVGLSIVGARGSDLELLRVAVAFEQAAEKA